jgi:hypothetical protein
MGTSRGGPTSKMRLMASGPLSAVAFTLMGGEASDAVEGRLVLDTVGRLREMGEEGRLYLLTDRA